jgi:signal transduction histidine kinase
VSGDTPARSPAWRHVIAAVLLLGGTLLLLGLTVTAMNDAGARVGVLPPAVAAATAVATLVVVAATVVSRREGRPRLESGCLWVGAGGLLPVWAAAPMLPAVVRAAALAAPPLVVLGVTQVGTDWSSPPSPRRLVQWLVAAAVLAHLLAYEPFRDPECAIVCSQADVPGAQLIPMGTLLAGVAVLTAVAAGLAASTVWARRAHTPVPVVVTSLLGLVLVVVVVAARWLPLLAPSSLEQALVPGLLAAAVPCVGVLLAWSTVYRTRREVRDLVLRLDQPGSGGDVLPYPMVAVHVATPDGRWVDVHGQEVDPQPTDGTSAVLLGTGVRLLMRSGAADAPAVLGRLRAADLVALSNARLAALTRAHQREVRESQRRIVALSDAERLRIERDLHDGAQQRLVGAKLHLRLAESSMPGLQAHQLTEAEHQVQVAIERLRALAHGVFPRLLESEGLTAALDELCSQAPVPMHLEIDALPAVEQRLPRDVATALYSAVAASVPLVGASRGSEGLAVHASVRPGWVTVRVDAPPSGGPTGDHRPLQDVADRLGAVGGQLTLHEEPHGWTLTAEAPCESS